MASLSYVGKTPASPNDLVTQGYVGTLGASSLTQTQVTNQINAGFSSFVTKTYVDQQNLLNATQAFVDAGDATRLHLSQIGVPNGVAGLDATGRIPIASLALPNTQRFPTPFISPTAYNSSAVTIAGSSSAGTASTIYSVAVADPGFTYKLLIFGQVDLSCSIDGRYAKVWVSQGSTSGQIVAVGPGLGENFPVGVTAQFISGSFSYQIPVGTGAVDIIGIGAGGGGGGAPFSGSAAHGGGAGSYASRTLIVGTDIAAGTPTLSGAVGVGGAGGNPNTVGGLGAPGTSGQAGTATTINYATSTLTASGGTGGSGASSGAWPGGVPAPLTFDGNVYNSDSVFGHGGDGGEFASGNVGSGLPGVSGHDGSVWIFCYPTPVTSVRGPAKLMPWPMNAQTPITGATTLYVQMQDATGATPSPTLTASTVAPSLWVCPVPA